MRVLRTWRGAKRARRKLSYPLGRMAGHGTWSGGRSRTSGSDRHAVGAVHSVAGHEVGVQPKSSPQASGQWRVDRCSARRLFNLHRAVDAGSNPDGSASVRRWTRNAEPSIRGGGVGFPHARPIRGGPRHCAVRKVCVQSTADGALGPCAGSTAGGRHRIGIASRSGGASFSCTQIHRGTRGHAANDVGGHCTRSGGVGTYAEAGFPQLGVVGDSATNSIDGRPGADCRPQAVPVSHSADRSRRLARERRSIRSRTRICDQRRRGSRASGCRTAERHTGRRADTLRGRRVPSWISYADRAPGRSSVPFDARGRIPRSAT